MNKSYVKTGLHNFLSLAELSFFPNESFDPDPYTKTACERLIHVADLFPSEKCLGLQMSLDREGEPHIFAFSDSDKVVTQEDFNWIFENSAIANSSSLVIDKESSEKFNKTYALIYTPHSEKKSNEYLSYILR